MGNREIRDERRERPRVVDRAVVAKILLQKLEKLTSPSVSLRLPLARNVIINLGESESHRCSLQV